MIARQYVVALAGYKDLALDFDILNNNTPESKRREWEAMDTRPRIEDGGWTSVYRERVALSTCSLDYAVLYSINMFTPRDVAARSTTNFAAGRSGT